MAKFTDLKEREWVLAITVADIRRVRQRLDVDLLTKDLPALLERLLSDYVLLADVLFVLVEPAAESAGVTDEDFGGALAGDPIEAASIALIEALRDFTPNPRDRARVGRLLEMILTAAEDYREQAEKELDRAVPAILAAVRTGAPFTSSQGSRESTPEA
ncbi:MAG: hypothetical protein KDE27_25580 [Planctomycetes bacterium]|nr:hypothetical protein [Planctomycetota bacterium]